MFAKHILENHARSERIKENRLKSELKRHEHKDACLHYHTTLSMPNCLSFQNCM